ncbi:MAG: flagellar assembly peptidoglycan hydrolase FlgJ [Gammaproteobacteria bacterium]|nr:MAG: flagellar assembly peptidoglycan hydrolase FlgJ [Gammaproteobacteria bacterium]
MNALEQAGFYADFAQFHDLRAQARADPRDPETLRRVAGQFEALFLQMMLKEMRKAVPSDGLFDNDQTRFYQGMYDRQIAVELARRPGLGLAELLVRQLEGKPGVPGRSRVTAPAATSPARAGARTGVPRGPARPAPEAALPPLDPRAWARGDPARFVRDLLPHARRVARRLGVPAEAIVAQAALETGWGRAIPRGPDGRPSHNLFGIKAGADWHGPRVAAGTLEFQEGHLRRVSARFRAYPSPEASLEDYARFLEGHPRYREALRARDPLAFVQALARAGYATDPHYAEKIAAILDRPAFRKVVAEFKPRAPVPMQATGAVEAGRRSAEAVHSRGSI